MTAAGHFLYNLRGNWKSLGILGRKEYGKVKPDGGDQVK